MYAGLSEAVIELRKKKAIKAKAKGGSLTEELYQTIAMLQEGNDPLTILNETYFQAAIFEALNVLNTINHKDYAKITAELRKARRQPVMSNDTMGMKTPIQNNDPKISDNTYSYITHRYAHDCTSENNTNKDLNIDTFDYIREPSY